MKIQKRRVNSQGHTLGYKIGGKWMTRDQAYKLAQGGCLDGVIACRGASGGYIQSHPQAKTRLYDLPEVSV